MDNYVEKYDKIMIEINLTGRFVNWLVLSFDH